ncbi:MAG: 50S ribosomal protein L18 [Spirochaetia bacterium]|nr:50S ribosomal protein L18 [Spirochaetia bacterium]
MSLGLIKEIQVKRKKRIRHKVKSNNKVLRPRIYLHISNKNMYAQLIDDKTGKTLVCAATAGSGFKDNKVNKNKETAKKLADIFTDKLKEKKVELTQGFVFDRGQRLYHGKVKEFAEKLRENGVLF